MSPEATRLAVLLAEISGIADPAFVAKAKEALALMQEIASRSKKPIDNRPPIVVVEVDGKRVDAKVGK